MKNWVELGVDVMREARLSRGLSCEAVGRLVNVSSKTVERYEKAGRVPEHQLELFASILGLEVSRPALRPVVAKDARPDDPVSLRDLDDRLRALETRVAALATEEQLKRGLDALRKAIDALATRGTRTG